MPLLEIPKCPQCGAQEWTRVSSMRLEACLTVLGSWEEYSDDYLADDKYFCYKCETEPEGAVLQFLVDQKG